MAAAASSVSSLARRRAWAEAFDLESACGDLTGGFACSFGFEEGPLVAVEHASERGDGAPLRLGVGAAEANESLDAVVAGRQGAQVPAHVAQRAA